jgi:hypothetical protein
MATNPNENVQLISMPSEKIEEFGEESQQETRPFQLVKENVSDQDIFKLGKTILLFVFIIFVLISVLRIVMDESKGVVDVWDFCKIVLNSITSLVLGLYFGKKSST